MNKKEQLIQDIMERYYKHKYYLQSTDTVKSQIEEILEKYLPEDNEWDVVEIKQYEWENLYWKYKYWNCTCWKYTLWEFDKYCPRCWKKIIRIDKLLQERLKL